MAAYRPLRTIAALGLLLALAACGGDSGGTITSNGPATTPGGTTAAPDGSATTAYQISGRISGLFPNSSVVLRNNASDTLTVSANGSFTFTQSVADGAAYAVTVLTQPRHATCSVTSGSGTASANVTSVQVNCAGNPAYAYVANYNDGTVSQFTIGAGGALTAMSPAAVATAAGSNPTFITVDPSGKYAYVANYDSNGTVSQFTIGANGTLTAMTPATASTGSGSYPTSVTIDPSGRYAYVANYNSTVSQFTVGADGTLTAMTPAAVAAGSHPTSVTVDPSGKYAYVTNYNYGNYIGTVSQFTIGADGTLTAMSPATVATGSNSFPLAVTVDPSGRYAYVANNDGLGTVLQFTIGPGGALTAMNPATVTTGSGLRTVSVAVDPSGSYAYVANYNNPGVISQFTIGADGTLTAMSPAAVTTGSNSLPMSVTVDPSGKYAYVANYNSPGTVSQFTIGTGGALTANGAAAAGAQPSYVVVAQP